MQQQRRISFRKLLPYPFLPRHLTIIEKGLNALNSREE